MRWLVIGLLASLGALLFMVGALTRHIWLRRKELRHETHAQRETREADLEIEP